MLATKGDIRRLEAAIAELNRQIASLVGRTDTLESAINIVPDNEPPNKLSSYFVRRGPTVRIDTVLKKLREHLDLELVIFPGSAPIPATEPKIVLQQSAESIMRKQRLDAMSQVLTVATKPRRRK